MRGLGESWDLNVLAFTAPIVSSITSVQTRPMLQHFPIKVNQDGIELTVIFRSEAEFERFQAFVRRHQVNAQRMGTVGIDAALVTLSWPERNISNWTGIIKEFRAGGERFNPAPHAKIGVSLVTSMVATRTDIASWAMNFLTIAGFGTPGGMLGLPTDLMNSIDQSLFGSTLLQANASNNNFFSPLTSILNGGLGLG
jgi:hypothetical protein